MQRDRAALPLVRDLDLQAEMSPSCRSSASRSASTALAALRALARPMSAPGPRPLRLLGAIFGLAHRQALGDDLLGQRLGIRRRRDGPGMAHADIALQ